MAPEIVSAIAKPSGYAKPTTLPSKAYLTFLAGDGDYVKGVVGLAKGLRKVKTAYALVVAVLPDVPVEHRRILEGQGCIVREIEPVSVTIDIQGSKPWRYTGKEENMQREDIKMLVKKWWDIYNNETLDYKKSVVANDGDAEPVILQPLISATMPDVGTVQYVTAPSAA